MQHSRAHTSSCVSTGAGFIGKCSGLPSFSQQHQFAKPNDAPALELMNEAARAVLREFKGHIKLAFGESDEYSFLIDRDSTLYSRRQR